MEPRDFLTAARALAALQGAAFRRSAISRAYEAVYHAAFDLLHTLGFRIPREHRGHEAVRAYLAQSRVTSVTQVAAQLDGLRALRVNADYWLWDRQPEDAAVVTVWLERAERMIAVLDAARPDQATCARITAALAATFSSTVASTCPATWRRRSSNSRSAGLRTGAYGGSAIFGRGMRGSRASRWLGAPSPTTAARSVGSVLPPTSGIHSAAAIVPVPFHPLRPPRPSTTSTRERHRAVIGTRWRTCTPRRPHTRRPMPWRPTGRSSRKPTGLVAVRPAAARASRSPRGATAPGPRGRPGRAAGAGR